MMAVHLTFVRLLEDILGIEVSMQQSAVIAHIVGDNSLELMRKWGERDPDTMALDNDEFREELIDVLVKCARQMKLKRVNRDTITEHLAEIHAESMRVSEEYKNEV